MSEGSSEDSERQAQRAQDASSRSAKFYKSLKTTNWRDSISNQCDSVVALQNAQAVMTGDQLREAIAKLGAGLRLPKERVAKMLHLTSFRDINRALQCGGSVGIRLPSEQIYPRDGWIGEYLTYVQGSETPIAFHFWTAVAVIGAACRRNFQIDMGNHCIFPNHYVLLIGPSGIKKGTALSAGRDMVERVNGFLDLKDVPEDQRIRILPGKLGPERFVEMLKAKEVTDVSPTGSLRTRYSDSIAYLPVPELSVLLGRSVFHSDVFIHLLTDLYDCHEKWDVSTIARKDEVLRNVAITFQGCSTPDWIRRSITEDIFTGGFMSRCIVCSRNESKRLFPRPDFLDPIMANELAKVLVTLATAKQQIVPVSCWDWFDSWYRSNKERLAACTDQKMRGYYERKPSHLLRLSTILTLAQGRNTVQVLDMHVADAILTEEEAHMAAAFSHIAQHEDDEKCERVLEIIWRNGKLMSRAQLLNKTVGFLGSAKALDRVVETLDARGVLGASYSPTKRKTTYVVKNWSPK